VLDALIVHELTATDDGLRAMTGWAAFAVRCSRRDQQLLLQAGADVGTVAILTVFELADDTAALVGFANEQRRELYRAVRRINGIGRQSAVAVLDCGEVSDILRAVAGDDHAFFNDVPRLGAKKITALCAELARYYQRSLPDPVPVPVRWVVDAREALAHEGINLTSAEHAAVVAARAEPKSPEQLLAHARDSMG
jgi:Holliday junction resolvasome RuvABC DNA-binding subunit